MKTINRSKSVAVLTVLAVLGGAGAAQGDTATWRGGTGDWDDPSKWDTEPDPDVVPCNNGRTFDVLIDDPAAVVTLDIECRVNKLTLLNGATLNVHGPLTFTVESSGDDALQIGGLFQVLNGVTVDVLSGRVHVAPGGVYQPHPDAVSGESSTLNAKKVLVDGGFHSVGASGGELKLYFDMILHVLEAGELKLDGTDPPPFGPGPAPMGGTTPPVLKVCDIAVADVDGDMSMEGAVDVTLKCTTTTSMSAPQSMDAAPHYHLVLGGNFNNLITNPDYSSFDGCDGGVLLNGTTPSEDPQQYPAFEVGSELRCDSPCDDDNFAIGLLAVQAGAKARFKDGVANQPPGVVPELQYAREVLFEPGATVAFDRTGVAFDAIKSGADVNFLDEDAFLSRLRELCPPPTPSSASWAVILAAIVLLVAGTLAIKRVRRAAA